MKRLFNVAKICKLSKNIVYEKTEEWTAIADEHGYIGVITKDSNILEEIKSKNVNLLERKGLVEMLNGHIFTKEEMFSLTETKIDFPVFIDGCSINTTALKFEGTDDEKTFFKFINMERLNIFDFDFVTTTRNLYSPVILICKDCYGVVCPVRLSPENQRITYRNIKEIADYLE